MMRALCTALLLCACRAAVANDSDLDALTLADEAPVTAPTPVRTRAWRAFTEAAGTSARPRGGGPARHEGRLSLDLRLEHAGDGPWRAVAASRLDLRSRPGVFEDHAVHTLKEAYLSHTAAQDTVLDIGRINDRQGVALGYNPTDLFRDGAVRSAVSMDPASLRENRQGSAMLRAQHLWDGGAFALALSPRLAERSAPRGGWNLDWAATNHRHRALLSYTQRWSETLSPQWLLLAQQGQPTQAGLNLSGLISNATVAYLEWSGGPSSTLPDQALERAAPTPWRNRLAVGATYTTASRLSFTGEAHYNGAAPGRAAWQALRAGPPLQYAQYRLWALKAQEPPTRHALFFHAAWKDAFVQRLDLGALLHLDRIDTSRRFWIEARYRADTFDLALQWQRSQGTPLSQFGAWPESGRWELTLWRYF